MEDRSRLGRTVTLDPPRGETGPDRPRREPGSPPATRRRAVGSTRIRIVVTYLLVLVVAAVVSMVAIRHVLLLRLEQRTEAALNQEVLEPPLLVGDIDPATGRPFDTLERAFDVYLDANVPSIEEGFVALVDGTITRDRLRSFPGNVIPADALAEFAEFSRITNGPTEQAGSFETEYGTARYRAVRVVVGADHGAFVVVILPAAGLREIGELQTYGTIVVAIVVTAAAMCAWFIAGRVLRPIRELTDTARSISESADTTRLKISPSGGEAAEMASTFNSMLDRLETATVDERDLFRAAGHELRAPLTVATGHLELIANGTFEQQSTLPLVLDELARMGKIIDDLQSLTGAGAPDFLAATSIDADLFVHELLAKVMTLAPRRWVIDSAPTNVFVGDRYRLTEAVMNLVDNAVAHTSTDDVIAIGADLDNQQVRIWVRDTGVGVLPEDIDRVFERFVRGQGAAHRYRGSGLGLSIVRSIAEAHGGRVELTGRPGHGATFTITIPRLDAATS